METGESSRLLDAPERAAGESPVRTLADTLASATRLPMGLLLLARPPDLLWHLGEHLHDLAADAVTPALRPVLVTGSTALPPRSDREHYPASRDDPAEDAQAGVGLQRLAVAGPGESILLISDAPLTPACLAALTLARHQHACVVGILTQEAARAGAGDLCEVSLLVASPGDLGPAAHELLAALAERLGVAWARPACADRPDLTDRPA